MVSNRRLSNGEGRSIFVRPLVRLARGASLESVLDDFAEIALEKGVDLRSVRFVRAGLQREFKPPGTAEANCHVSEIEIGVEGGQTRLLVKFHGPLSVLIATDADVAGDSAARRLAVALAAFKCRARRLRPPRAKDWNDELLRLGRSRMQSYLSRCVAEAKDIVGALL